MLKVAQFAAQTEKYARAIEIYEQVILILFNYIVSRMTAIRMFELWQETFNDMYSLYRLEKPFLFGDTIETKHNLRRKKSREYVFILDSFLFYFQISYDSN